MVNWWEEKSGGSEEAPTRQGRWQVLGCCGRKQGACKKTVKKAAMAGAQGAMREGGG